MKNNLKIRNNFFLLSAVILFVIFISIRFYQIEADPDTTLTRSSTFYTDEGWFSTNSAEKFLTDEWLSDDFNYIVLIPVMSHIRYFFFKIFDMSLFSARLPSLILSTCSIFILLLFIISSYKKNFPNLLKILFVTVIIMGTNYYYLIYSRVAYSDLPMFFFGFTALFLFYRALLTKNNFLKYLYYFATSIFLVISLYTKTTGAIFLLTIFFSLIIIAFRNTQNNKKYLEKGNLIGNILLILITTISIIAVYLLLKNSYKDGFNEITSFLLEDKLGYNPLNPIMLITSYAYLVRVCFIWKNWSLLLLSFVSIGFIIFGFIKKKDISVINIIFISLFFSILIFLGFFYCKPTRYFVGMVIPISYLIGILPIQFLEFRKEFHWYSGILKKLSFISILLIVVIFNSWNFIKLAGYYSNMEFTIRDLQEKINNDISLETSKDDRIIVCGEYSALLALLKVNNHDIKYRLARYENYYRVYEMETAKVYSKIKENRRLRFVSKYDVLNNYNDFEFRLYEILE